MDWPRSEVRKRLQIRDKCVIPLPPRDCVAIIVEERFGRAPVSQGNRHFANYDTAPWRRGRGEEEIGGIGERIAGFVLVEKNVSL